MTGLNKLVQDIVLAISEDIELMKLLHYRDREEDIMMLPEVDIDKVVGTNLLDYTFVPDTKTEASSYVSVSLDNIEKAVSRRGMGGRSETIRQMDVVITVFTHYSLVRYYGGNRLLAIVDRLEAIFETARMESVVNKFDFSLVKEVTMIPEYSGYDVVFRINTIKEALKPSEQ